MLLVTEIGNGGRHVGAWLLSAGTTLTGCVAGDDVACASWAVNVNDPLPGVASAVKVTVAEPPSNAGWVTVPRAPFVGEEAA